LPPRFGLLGRAAWLARLAFSATVRPHSVRRQQPAPPRSRPREPAIACCTRVPRAFCRNCLWRTVGALAAAGEPVPEVVPAPSRPGGQRAPTVGEGGQGPRTL